jgi:glycosyltransferase involved in cell wall biosynthesis
VKLEAIHKPSGKVLLSSSGNVREAQFLRTVAANFPSVDPSDVEIVSHAATRRMGKARARPLPPRGDEVVWRGSFMDLGGYANMNREICLRLPFHGLRVKVDMLQTGQQVDRQAMSLLRAMSSTTLDDEKMATLVVGFTPMSVRPVQGRRTVFFTMMETQGLHPEFARRCNEGATEVWAPCSFYADVFRAGGITKPVHVLPLGVNHLLYVPGAREPRLRYTEYPSGREVHSLPDDVFRFMALFGWSHRKGTDVLCRSFLRAFDGRDEAVLVIYSRYMASSSPQCNAFIRDEIMGYYEELGKEELPARIYHCGEEIPIPQLPGCYAAADCFVCCSRGEGFSLPVIEAAACGTPVISACHTGMTQFLDEDVAHLVHPAEYGPADGKLDWITEYYKDQDFALLGEEETDVFSGLMRRVIDEPDEAEDKAGAFRMRVLEDYTWDRCAERVAERLGEGG